MQRREIRWRSLGWVLAACVGGGAAFAASSEELGRPAKAAEGDKKEKEGKVSETETREIESGSLGALLGGEVLPIDLAAALKLGGVSNPEILLARQRVVEAVALRQLAAAQILPSLHVGLSYDDHNGNLQQSSGNILKVDRSSLYIGAGASAVAAGTVGIPGVFWAGNISETIYGALIAHQVVEVRAFASRAVENEMLLRIAVTYTELVRAEGLSAIARKNLEDARAAEHLTATFAKAGAGNDADADRARAERGQREAERTLAEGKVLIVSARLAELLNLDPTTRLSVQDDKVIPCPVVPDPIPLPELVAIALLNRPELKERQAVIRQSLLALESSQVLPFSPTVILGLSYGAEAGGSNLVAQPVNTDVNARGEPRFSPFEGRLDFDAVAFWTAQNLGLGNKALIQSARSRLGTAELQLLEKLDRVRAEVANAYSRTHARYAQIGTAEQAVRDATASLELDSKAIRGGAGKPIELLESLRLLARARITYLNAIADYNRAQLELYVALGQPPANTLARRAPANH
jgi:outer membrane protein TolC